DGGANNIVVESVDGGNLKVTDNGAPVRIRSFGGTPTLARTAAVAVYGLGGNDTITIDDSMGTVPAAVSGGSGNDTITAEHQGNSVLSGDGGKDTVTGGGGYDLILGGFGDDELDGGGQDGQRDVLVGGPGADTFIQHADEEDIFLDVNADDGDVIEDA
ncbi:MAG: hypothetical protein L0Z62_07330, partial [Gemmataceae bacterium]|nr:hypothetical protein [Gemmataceae bacterium]